MFNQSKRALSYRASLVRRTYALNKRFASGFTAQETKLLLNKIHDDKIGESVKLSSIWKTSSVEVTPF
ncbi:hypothetical protein JL09_g6223, partial [Pichia kudriavzevii]